jgi:hypothetical protein
VPSDRAHAPIECAAQTIVKQLIERYPDDPAKRLAAARTMRDAAVRLVQILEEREEHA